MRLPDLEGWAIFAAVAADARSFSGAAEAIGVSKATVSKAVSRLEARLGVSLFHRTSRRLALTEAGTTLAEHARAMLAQAHAAEEIALRGRACPRDASGSLRRSASGSPTSRR
ncbi:LysR family transcriptional regulator [Sphingomonas sp. MMS24-JH45]